MPPRILSRVWLACILCVAAGPGMGSTGASGAGAPLTLEAAIVQALVGSRAAIVARLGRDEQKFALKTAEGRYDPTISLGAAATTRRSGDRTADVSVGSSLPVRTGGSFRLSVRKPLAGEPDLETSTELGFSQPLLKGFGPDIDTAPLRRAYLRERIAVRAFRDKAAGIVDSVISAYRAALKAGQRLEIAREALQRARRQLEVNRTLVEAGRMAPQDLVQSEAEVTNKEYDLTDSEHELEIANSVLVNILDLDEETRVELQEEPPVKPEQPDLEESLETAFARRTDWLRAELGMDLARIDLRVAQNDRLPDLSLDVTAFRGGGLEGTDWTVGLNLTAPVQNEEARRAIAQARNDLRLAAMELAERRQSIRIQVRRAVRNVAVALRQIDFARRSKHLTERKLDVERRKLRQGLSSAFQLGRFEDDLVTAQRRELDAVVDYRNALTGLDRTLGVTLDRWGLSVERVGR